MALKRWLRTLDLRDLTPQENFLLGYLAGLVAMWLALGVMS